MQGDFEIELIHSNRVLVVHANERIIDVLDRIGVNVPVACEQGICGSCETHVLAGTPDHRCEVLTPEERAEGKVMMVCCGRSLSPRLVLDL